MRAVLALALCLLTAVAARADDDPDAAALLLPGAEPPPVEDRRMWRMFAEGAAGWTDLRPAVPGPAGRATQRLSLDLQLDAPLASGLRAVFADRLDVDWQRHRQNQRHEANTLKEAYLSWRPSNDLIVDLGRVNQHAGVAVGYNPTDFFRDGALRSVVTVDPASLKKDRQGSVMLRAQALWEGASLTALYSPALAQGPNAAAFNPDWGATNARDRGLLIFSKRLGEDLNPQWLLYKDAGASPQLGMNLTRLLNDATVAYVEWSGGRRRPLLAQAQGQAVSAAYRNRVSAGFTLTTSAKLSLSLELQYNGTGLNETQWQALPEGSLPAFAGYLQFAQARQELVTRHAAMLHATWQDVLVNRLDLAALVRRNQEDGSRLAWMELRYHWDRDELAWQWQRNAGRASSEYGASLQRWAWQWSYRHFF